MEYFNGTIIELENDKITRIQSFNHSDYNFTLHSKTINHMIFNNQQHTTIYSNDKIQTIITLINESE